MNKADEIIQRRKSVRSYADRPLSSEDQRMLIIGYRKTNACLRHSLVCPFGYPAEKHSLTEKVFRAFGKANMRKEWNQIY